jgi:hypothetical protein
MLSVVTSQVLVAGDVDLLDCVSSNPVLTEVLCPSGASPWECRLHPAVQLLAHRMAVPFAVLGAACAPRHGGRPDAGFVCGLTVGMLTHFVGGVHTCLRDVLAQGVPAVAADVGALWLELSKSAPIPQSQLWDAAVHRGGTAIGLEEGYEALGCPLAGAPVRAAPTLMLLLCVLRRGFERGPPADRKVGATSGLPRAVVCTWGAGAVVASA